MIDVGIIGGAGYTAGELIRLLLQHPAANIVFVHSSSHAGEPVYAVHRDLLGDCGLTFTDQVSYNIDVLFICAGHGKAVRFLEEHEVPARVKVIDLSQDFRNIAGYEVAAHKVRTPFQYNGKPPRTFVYGLPELQRETIRTAQNIANPGCFATAFQLALLPLAKAGLLKQEVHVHAITGSTGAGQAPSETTHFSWRNNNLSIYKAFSHQHLTEVRQTLGELQGSLPQLNFLPLRGDFARGIFLSAYTAAPIDGPALEALYKDFYRDAALTFVSDTPISMKDVVNTAKCFLRAEKIGDQVLVTSVIDNLLKGASGQAVQNMNLMCGLDERTGLYVKPQAF